MVKEYPTPFFKNVYRDKYAIYAKHCKFPGYDGFLKEGISKSSIETGTKVLSKIQNQCKLR